jgi:cystathionine beta-lyase/cystathionine gamma-synthase
MVLHSATKFLGGHGDVIAGAVACGETMAAALRQVRVATGALMHPWAAYLLHRSLPTLKLRIERAQASAEALIDRLEAHPAVNRVYYPGRASSRQHDLRQRQMSGGGCILAFEMAGGYDAAASVMQRVALMTPAVSLGSVDTLIQHPAGLTHRVVSDEGKRDGGIGPGLLRLSVGLEEPEDLWDDLEQAFREVRRAPTGPSSCAGPLRDAFPSARKTA